jgi:asparagine synthase (glutamine-hydrolysing)
MCGIFSVLNYNNNNNNNIDFITNCFNKGKKRGPEYSSLKYYDEYNSLIGFHRLAINGLNSESNQPIIIDNIALICNGEIYNYKKLYDMMPFVTPQTGSDCEVIIHLYKNFGIEQTLIMLDGVFAFILYTPDNIYVARDPYGIRPLYCYIHGGIGLSFFSSELKCLVDIDEAIKIEQFKPSHYITFKQYPNVYNGNTYYRIIGNSYYKRYHIPNFPSYYEPNIFTEEFYLKTIFNYLKTAVYKRCCTTERPIACLLSGGLDSSLIASLVCLYAKENNLPQVETYSIGLAESEDLKYAQKVADHIGSKHINIIVTEQDMTNAVPKVIYDIESYDTTTVRASIGNWLIGKYISEHSDAKVIFNGDGSDEVTGGYLYMKLCPNNIEYNIETYRLLDDIYTFDVLRSDKCISSHGLEPRTPFLDKTFVNMYLSIPLEVRVRKNEIEKYILRKAFSDTGLLPDEILWRKKEAFSDGVSSKGRSLYQILQEHASNELNKYQSIKIDESNLNKYDSNINSEKVYYKQIFTEKFYNCTNIIPYYWMPKYTNANDPSARTLDVYNS